MNVLDTITMLAATEPEEGAEAASGIASLGIDPIQIAFQAGTFVVLFILLRKFAFKKITALLEDRHQTIEDGLANAEKASKQLDASVVKQEEILKTARTEAEQIIAKAHEESGIMIKEAEEAAQKRSDKVVADAEHKLGQEVAKAKSELRSELANLVADATEAIIQQKMTEDSDKALIEKTIKQQTKGAEA